MQAWCWRKACSCLIHWRNSQELFNHVKKYYPCNAAKDRETYGGRLSKCWMVKLKGLGADIIYGPNFSSMSTTEISRRNTCLRGIWATCLYTYVSHVYIHTLESPWNLLPFFRKKERKRAVENVLSASTNKIATTSLMSQNYRLWNQLKKQMQVPCT